MIISPPPSPAIAAESANATIRVRRWLMPIDAAATSLPRIASSDAAGRAAPHPDHRDAHEREDDQRQHEVGLVALAEVDRTEHRAGHDQDLRAAADPAELQHDLVEEERERERRERQEDAAEPHHRDREQRADDRGDAARR